MIPVQGYQDKKIAVLGLGRSGLATAVALEAGGAIPVVWDDNPAARERAAAKGYTATDLRKPAIWQEISRLIVSPGIPHLYPEPHDIVTLAQSAGVPVDNDIGLFFQSYPTRHWSDFDVLPRIVAITGSNGKSTTAALIHHLLQHAKCPTQLAGNIGRGVLDIDPAHDGEVVVLELSSYQTELARSLTPDVAVFTNISPDHLDRHGGPGGYFAAKRRLFVEGGPDRAIIGVDQPEGQFLAGQLSEGAQDDRVIRVSVEAKLAGPGWSVFARKGFLSEYRKGRQVASIDLRQIRNLPGRHNHQNACCAYAAARTLGLAPKVIEAGLHSFSGLAHRSQVVADKDGVRFVNDSKATNVDSALKALEAFDNIRWIAGGQGKEGGISALTPHLQNVRKAYLIGASAPDFAAQLTETPYQICHSMDQAVVAAAADAQPGDTVLLAPAAASFDQYPDFEARGQDFMDQVAKL